MKKKILFLLTLAFTVSNLFSQPLLPTTNCSTDIGSSAFKWKDQYLCGSVYMNTFRLSSSGSSASIIFNNSSPSLYTGNNSIFIGSGAGAAVTNGAQNVFIGTSSGATVTSTNNNTFVGHGAGKFNTAAANSFFGWNAGTSNTSGTGNTALGTGALSANTTGISSTAVGSNALSSQNLGNKGANTAVGASCAVGITTGDANVCIGKNAGSPSGNLKSIISGSNNIIIGYEAGVDIGNITNATLIGTSTNVGESNSMVFGNSTVSRWGFGINTSDAYFTSGTSKALVVGVFGSGIRGNGAYLTVGGVWMSGSDVNIKENFKKLDPIEILSKIKELEVTQWDYKGTSPAETHIGPMAQDFQRIFGIGDGKGISDMDKVGIALLGIKALEMKNDQMEKENATLKEKLEEIEKVVASCCKNNQEFMNIQKAALMQNQPNPFSQKTQIAYRLPETFSKATMRIFNSNGVDIQSINLEKGSSNVDFEGRTFSSGIYVYSLEIDGVTIETKQMIVTK